MTPQKKFTLIFWLAASVIMLVSYYLLEYSQRNLLRTKAKLTAEIVANQVLMDRKVYTENLVQKLAADGVGASVNSHELTGFIPLPAQFVRAVSERIKSNKQRLYQYSLISEWNLNPNQGIQGTYEQQAWIALKQQEKQFKQAGAQQWDWQPVVQFVQGDEGLVLRYMRADTATAKACITCHNAYEQRPEIVKIREEQGVAPRKVWRLGELMGAVQVDVPLARFEAIAAADRYAMLLAVFAACGIGFMVLYQLIYVQVIKPVQDEAAAKDSFLAKMSHEIRTPLNAIINMGKFLTDGELDKGQQQHMRMLNQSSAQLLEIVNDILDFSKVQAGEVKVEKIPFDIVDLVKSCTDAFIVEAMHKGVALEHDVGPGIDGYVVGDPLRIRQVLQNLISNAVKFTEEGEITVAVDKAPSGVKFTVVDTGIGIAPERQQAVFMDFVQADNSTSRAYGGTGLGLTICKSLVELMGGDLQLESSPGDGTTITFELELPDAEEPKLHEQDLFAEEHRFDDLKVLVVEDNPINQMVAQAVLSRWGASVKVAADGQEALDYVEDCGEPDVILMDYHMPVMNGLQATRLMRDQGVTVPILALSAAALPEEVQQCFDAGMDDFLAKPLDRRALNAALHKWLK